MRHTTTERNKTCSGDDHDANKLSYAEDEKLIYPCGFSSLVRAPPKIRNKNQPATPKTRFLHERLMMRPEHYWLMVVVVVVVGDQRQRNGIAGGRADGG